MQQAAENSASANSKAARNQLSCPTCARALGVVRLTKSCPAPVAIKARATTRCQPRGSRCQIRRPSSHRALSHFILARGGVWFRWPHCWHPRPDSYCRVMRRLSSLYAVCATLRAVSCLSPVPPRPSSPSSIAVRIPTALTARSGGGHSSAPVPEGFRPRVSGEQNLWAHLRLP